MQPHQAACGQLVLTNGQHLPPVVPPKGQVCSCTFPQGHRGSSHHLSCGSPQHPDPALCQGAVGSEPCTCCMTNISKATQHSLQCSVGSMPRAHRVHSAPRAHLGLLYLFAFLSLRFGHSDLRMRTTEPPKTASAPRSDTD